MPVQAVFCFGDGFQQSAKGEICWTEIDNWSRVEEELKMHVDVSLISDLTPVQPKIGFMHGFSPTCTSV
jgi:hypothetical protein